MIVICFEEIGELNRYWSPLIVLGKENILWKFI